jgi:hypothetical protein
MALKSQSREVACDRRCAGRCPRPGCGGTMLDFGEGLECLLCSRSLELTRAPILKDRRRRAFRLNQGEHIRGAGR